jgi:hypothetical protein
MQAERTKQTADPICAFIELVIVQQALLIQSTPRDRKRRVSGAEEMAQILECEIRHALLQRYMVELGYLYPLGYHGYKLIVRAAPIQAVSYIQ